MFPVIVATINIQKQGFAWGHNKKNVSHQWGNELIYPKSGRNQRQIRKPEPSSLGVFLDCCISGCFHSSYSS